MIYKKLAILGIVLFLAIGALSGCSTIGREMKTIGSDMNGGLDRTVTLYDYQGDKLGEWSGKFDISETENEIYFDDSNGKRVIIQGGIVVCEEN